MARNDGFDALFRSHSAALRRYLRRLVGLEAAEDLTQESFERACRADLSEGRAPNVVLFHIAHNLAINHRERVRVAARHQGLLAGAAQEQEVGPSLERIVAARQELERVLAAIEALPPRRREIVKLARLQGLSGSEIAARLGIRQKSVEKQLALAISDLMDHLRSAEEASASPPLQNAYNPGSHHG